MRLARLASALLFLSLAGCGFVDDLIADKVVEDQQKIRSMDGVYAERGTIPQDRTAIVRTHARFVAPASCILEVVSPPEYAGDTFAYVGNELWWYSTQGNYGLHVRSVPWDPVRWREVVRENVKISRSVYSYSQADQPDTIAGRVASEWTVTPDASDDFVLPGRLWLDKEFTVPLRVELGDLYELRFEEVAFNRPTEPLAYAPPANATWFELDLADPPLTLEEAARVADFEIVEPKSEEFTRTRIVRAKSGELPIVTLLYERGPFQASVTETRDRGWNDPGLRGLAVDLGGVRGRLSFAATSTVIVFARDGVLLSVVTDLPPHEAVRFARTLSEDRR